MLRLPPTIIGLGRSDIQEYDRRRKISQWIDADKAARKSPCISVTKDSPASTSAHQSFAQFAKKYPDLRQFSLSFDEITLNDDKVSKLTPSSGGGRRLVKGIAKSINNQYVTGPVNSQKRCAYTSRRFSTSNLSFSNDFSVKSQIVEDSSLGNISQQIPLLGSVRFQGRAPPDDSQPSYILSCDKFSRISHKTREDLPKVSCVINHNSSGLLFSQPPRKLTRRSTRIFRHQENSFSLDSLEPEDSNFARDRDFKKLTNLTASGIIGKKNFQMEPREISLQSSRVKSVTSVAFQCVEKNESNNIKDEEFKIARHEFPPPSLLLPSATKQKIFISGSLSESSTSSNSEISFNVSPYRCQGTKQKESNKDLSLVDNFDINNQIQPVSMEKILSTNPKINNNSTPLEDQPQTPESLPESSCVTYNHLPFTESNLWSHGRSRTVDGRSTFQNLSGDSPLTPLTRSSDSACLMSGGLFGLYGGKENGDDEKNWSEGIIDNAFPSFQRFRERDINEVELESTPGPENWRQERLV